MSRFFQNPSLTPYVPGEQPKMGTLVKLNTNESPFPPVERALYMAAEAGFRAHLYSDPTASSLRQALAEKYGVSPDCVTVGNGSDEILDFAFGAFCCADTGAVFADITYGFYPVFADRQRVPYRTVPLHEDFSIRPADYFHAGGTVFIANPNAPTGMALPWRDIEKIAVRNPHNVVVVDEAYVDFGGESAVPLIRKYDNLIVTQTFSKARSMAGARLGMGIASPAIIRDLNAIKYSTNPYNVNSMTAAAGIGTMADEEYTLKNCKTIIENREYVSRELESLGFEMTDSMTNFVFAKHPRISGEDIYKGLRERGILVRHFTTPRICEYNRITVGSMDEMKSLVAAIKDIIKE